MWIQYIQRFKNWEFKMTAFEERLIREAGIVSFEPACENCTECKKVKNEFGTVVLICYSEGEVTRDEVCDIWRLNYDAINGEGKKSFSLFNGDF